MSLYDELIKSGARTVAFLGLAKNAGKTTALNSLTSSVRTAGGSLVLASIGRDGEAFDAVTMKPKPPVHVMKGDLVATTDSLIRASGLEFSVESDLKVDTPLGRTHLYRIHSAGGNIVLAGMNHVSSMITLKKQALTLADFFFIDGAVNRRSSGVPELADGIIISTGAVLGGSCKEVIQRTAGAVSILNLPGVPQKIPPLRQIIYHRGALTDKTAAKLLKKLPPGPQEAYLAAEDPSKIFLSEMSIARLSRRRITLRVLKTLTIISVTVNPHNPSGPDLSARDLEDGARLALAPLAVFNIV